MLPRIIKGAKHEYVFNLKKHHYEKASKQTQGRSGEDYQIGEVPVIAIYEVIEGLLAATAEGAEVAEAGEEVAEAGEEVAEAEDVLAEAGEGEVLAESATPARRFKCSFILPNSFFTKCSFANVARGRITPEVPGGSATPLEMPETPANPINVPEVLAERGEWEQGGPVPRDLLYDSKLFDGPGIKRACNQAGNLKTDENIATFLRRNYFFFKWYSL